MREHSTKLMAFVMLLLSAALIWFVQSSSASAAKFDEGTVFLPILPVRPQPPAGDLKVVHLGLYQSVQNQSNDVTLVARKPAVLRVFSEASLNNGTPIQASVTVNAYRDGKYFGTLNSPRQPVPEASTIENLDSTFNFDLPLEWLEGKIQLNVSIDRSNAIVEQNEGNNEMQGTFVFRAVPKLELTIVPITYIDNTTGVTYWEPGHDPISQWLLAAFPVSEIAVSIHQPLEFSGDLRQGEDWGRLLQDLTDLWALEVGPGSSHIYYGLVPNSAPNGASWFHGGISGLGWIGQRVSLGLDVGEGTGASAGHEIGHNFGRRHAPCGNASGLDPRYPYPNGSIGVYGLDTLDEILHDPSHSHDMMSYCGPEWVSDYTYEGLFQDQAIRASRSPVTRSEGWFISALVDDEKVTINPIKVVTQPILSTDSRSNLRVQLLDATGEVLGTFPAEYYQAEEEGVSVIMLAAHIPIPADRSAVETIQFLDGDDVLGKQLINDVGSFD